MVGLLLDERRDAYPRRSPGKTGREMMRGHTTGELLAAQSHREHVEQVRAVAASEPQEFQAHERRAAKAAYLRQRLETRAAAEHDASSMPDSGDG